MNKQNRADTSTRNQDLQDRLQRLAGDAQALSAGQEQRRENLVARALERGLGRPEAEEAYDVAREVGLPPAMGMALVIEGISVRPLDGGSADVDASEAVEPEWVDAPPPAEAASRERRLRQTFRRLRSLIEDEDSPADAVRAFAREPDLETYDYRRS